MKPNLRSSAGYARNNPSGTLYPNLIAMAVKAQDKFPPAESPPTITVLGEISKYL